MTKESKMRKLMLTTALVAVTSMGAVAQTADQSINAESEMVQNGGMVPAFLVSDFTGKNLHALDTEATRDLQGQRGAAQDGAMANPSARWESDSVFIGERDMWDNVGNIDDVVLTKDGELRGVLVDVGGFLGFGARTVLVSIDDLYFVADDSSAEDIDDFFVVATLNQEQLEALPEWDSAQLNAGFEARNYGAAPDQNTQAGMSADTTEPMDTASTDPGVENQTAAPGRTEVPDGYVVLEADERSADRLMGADVYGREGDSIATVDDLIMGDTGEVTHAVMDVGGFLGLGSHTIALEIDDLDILWSDENDDVRVQVTMTQEEMESLPEYEG